MMQEWLKARGQTLPDPHAHHQHGATLMPRRADDGGDGEAASGQRRGVSTACSSKG